jgi:hypothetical protein
MVSRPEIVLDGFAIHNHTSTINRVESEVARREDV